MKPCVLKCCLSLVLGSFLSSSFAQQSTTASGGDATGSGGSSAYSIGQPIYTTNTHASGAITQGVQQPYEIFLIVGEAEKYIRLSINAYPNPTEHSLKLSIDNFNSNQMTYQLLDLAGKLLEEKNIVSHETDIVLSHFAAAAYLLRITASEKEIKSFRIVKN
jgi:hypothetical protein